MYSRKSQFIMKIIVIVIIYYIINIKHANFLMNIL
jgi:hypothetical protein